MPRKKRVYWIDKPHDLTKCHSRRCEYKAANDRLCSDHWTTWKMAGFQPPMPASYAGGRSVAPERPPLKADLDERKTMVELVKNEVANIRVDDPETPDILEATIEDLEKQKAELEAEREAQLAPFKEAHRKTKAWFEPTERSLDAALELAKQRLEVSKSSIRAIAWPTRKKKVAT